MCPPVAYLRQLQHSVAVHIKLSWYRPNVLLLAYGDHVKATAQYVKLLDGAQLYECGEGQVWAGAVRVLHPAAVAYKAFLPAALPYSTQHDTSRVHPPAAERLDMLPNGID